ncbi:16038_t:CDS:1, partial [Acaulospora colombiana]
MNDYLMTATSSPSQTFQSSSPPFYFHPSTGTASEQMSPLFLASGPLESACHQAPSLSTLYSQPQSPSQDSFNNDMFAT